MSEKIIEEIHIGIKNIENKLNEVCKIQASQANEIGEIRIQARKASELALEAKRDADSARIEVSTISQAMIRHVTSVENVMKEHEIKLNDACKVLDDQTESLNTLILSDTRREATEQEREKFIRAQWGFIKWALPLSATTVCAVISGVVWIMTHYPLFR